MEYVPLFFCQIVSKIVSKIVSYAKEEERGLFGLFGGRSNNNPQDIVLCEESQFEITIKEENGKSFVRAISKDGNIADSEQLLSKINESLS